MQIFIDSANEKDIRYLMKQGVVDGVTTNPTIMFKDGVYDVEKGAKRLASLIGERPFSVEVTSNDHEEMVAQGRVFATWGPNIVVKIPVVNEFGEPSLDVINELTSEG